MSRFFVFLIICFVGLQAQAQEKEYCGTQGIDEEWALFLREHQGTFPSSRNCEIFIPITVHVLGDDNGVGYHSLSSVFGSLQALNEDFAETGISFFLSQDINYINRTSWYNHTGFSQGAQMMVANNVVNTVNCYIVENAAENCGYRSFNGDAIALAKSCTQPKDHTWAHEMGHWLSLPHTFFGWEGSDYDDSAPTPAKVGTQSVELWDETNCTSAADRICDTKADYLSFRWNCDENMEYQDSLTDPNGVRFAVDGSLFMSYALDDCQSRFSGGQTADMCTYIQNWVPEVISDDPPLDPVDIMQTDLIYPINGELVQGAVQLQWKENGSATFYIVEISRFPNMGILSARELVSGNSLDVFGLTEGKNYYWRLRAMNEYDFNYNNKSSVEKFETGELSSTSDYYASHLKVYPNPIGSNKSFFIDLDSQVGETISLTITGLDGRNVHSNKHWVKNGSNKIEVNVPSLTSGIYILSAVGELHKFQKKIVIE